MRSVDEQTAQLADPKEKATSYKVGGQPRAELSVSCCCIQRGSADVRRDLARCRS